MPKIPATPTPHLPPELWSLIYSNLPFHSPSPHAYALTCRAFALVASDPHSVAMLLVKTFGVRNAIYEGFVRGCLSPEIGRVLVECGSCLGRWLVQLAIKDVGGLFTSVGCGGGSSLGTTGSTENGVGGGSGGGASGGAGASAAGGGGVTINGNTQNPPFIIPPPTTNNNDNNHNPFSLFSSPASSTASDIYTTNRRRVKMSYRTFSWIVQMGLELYGDEMHFAEDDSKIFRDLVSEAYEAILAAHATGGNAGGGVAGGGGGAVVWNPNVFGWGQTLPTGNVNGIGNGTVPQTTNATVITTQTQSHTYDQHPHIMRLINSLHALITKYRYTPIRHTSTYSSPTSPPTTTSHHQPPPHHTTTPPQSVTSTHSQTSYLLYRLASIDITLLDALVHHNGFDLRSVNDEVLKWVLRREVVGIGGRLREFVGHGFVLGEGVVGFALQLGRGDVVDALRGLVVEGELREYAESTIMELLGPSRICATESLLTHLRTTFALPDSVFERALLVQPTSTSTPSSPSSSSSSPPPSPTTTTTPQTRCYNQQHPATAWRWTLRTFGPTHRFTNACFDDVLRKLSSGESHCCLRGLPKVFLGAGVRMRVGHVGYLGGMGGWEETVGVGRELVRVLRGGLLGEEGEGGKRGRGAGHGDLSEANESIIQDNDQLRSIFLINCGGLVDITEYLSINEQMTIYVADSHRPANLHNLLAHDNVMVLDDGESSGDVFKEIKEAFEELEFEDSDEEDEGSDGEDPEYDGDLSVQENEAEEDGLNVEDGDDQELRSPSKRKRGSGAFDDRDINRTSNKRLRASERRRRRRRHKRKLADYYGDGTYFGMAVASIMYTMAVQLGRASNDLLWLAIIGLTDHYLHERLGQDQYDSLVSVYKEEVARFNLDDNPNESQDFSDLDSILNDPIDGNAKGTGGNTVKNADDRRIRCEDEFRLMLLRHWSLYESMYHSPYVATRMGVWREKGRQRLTNLMVKMGFPHREAQQLYREMSLPFKRSVKTKLTQIAPTYNLPNLVFTSFNRAFGYKGTISASDAVHALTALLDCGDDWIQRGNTASDRSGDTSSHAPAVGRVGRDMEEDKRISGLVGVGAGTRTGMAGVALRVGDYVYAEEEETVERGEDEDEEEFEERRRKASARRWVKYFFVAYDALEDFDVLHHGIHLSMTFQRQLVRAAVTIMDKRMTQTLKRFSLTVLKGGGMHHHGPGSMEDKFALFGRSVSHLQRLAAFLAEGLKVFGKKDLPLVIAALNEDMGSYLVVGYAGISTAGDIRRNHFGLSFQASADKTRARVKHDGFETSVMEIRKEDLADFLEVLQTVKTG
ncbi:hypothetical protein HDV00_002695 [Rhizophlyctis rosea]|nr:hypothetical protein HDV00_002695 [Rhizophlyctis rosea]